MDISQVNDRRLTFGELASLSVQLLFKSAIPAVKLFLFCSLLLLAGFVCWLLLIGVMPFWLSMTTGYFLWLGTSVSFTALCFMAVNVYDKLISSKPIDVLEVIGDFIKALPALIAATLIVTIVFVLGVNLPLYFIKNPIVILPYFILVLILMIAICPYIMFFPLAILLRGAGPLESFRYSYYMVKGRWMEVFLKVLLYYLVVTVAFSVICGLIMLLFVLVNMAAINSFSAMGAMGLIFAIASMPLAFASLMLFFVFLGFVASFLWSSFLTLLFRNMEKEDTVKKEEYPVIDPSTPAEDSYEFTEIFKNIKEIDVSVDSSTERLSAIGPRNREEALREFQHEEPTIPPVTDPADSERSRKTVVRVDNYPAGSGIRSMPTLEITQRARVSAPLPSIYKKEDRGGN